MQKGVNVSWINVNTTVIIKLNLEANRQFSQCKFYLLNNNQVSNLYVWTLYLNFTWGKKNTFLHIKIIFFILKYIAFFHSSEIACRYWFLGLEYYTDHKPLFAISLLFLSPSNRLITSSVIKLHPSVFSSGLRYKSKIKTTAQRVTFNYIGSITAMIPLLLVLRSQVHRTHRVWKLHP